MKRTDVRIGNYIEVENLKTGQREVAPVNLFIILNWNQGELYRYNPLEINNDWLDKLGFQVSETYGCINIHGVPFYVSVKPNEQAIIIGDADGSGQIVKRVIYVHSLQNIIHALTGHELTDADIIDDAATRILKNIIEP